ncbi:MAG: hypothetical protein HYX78_05095 [Armatimonadetes bacterium]|nr:hypothetical protein [Armatimonadota bacterium]
MLESALTFPYWDVRPRLIVQPYDQVAKSVPLEILGSPDGEVGFTTTEPTIAAVSGGVLTYGAKAGAAVIVAEAISDGIAASRRYVQVEVGTQQEQPPAPPPIRQIVPSGYVEELPDGVRHFKYFTDWFDEWGCNIRVQGELAITLDLDKHYRLRFDVWGEIESMAAHNHDTLDLYFNDRWKRNFNPSPVIYPAWNQPCVIPRRTEWIDLWEFIGRSVTVRFVWDTRDHLYQMFDGWYVGNIELTPPWVT